MPTSVIIPAHNEASVVARCLSALTEGAREGELEVIVVCNGCTDDTAELARRFGPPVKVIESDIPSKSNALNLGDQAASGYPRFYVDADVVFPLDSLRQVSRVLANGEVLAAAPRMEFELAGRSWPIRAYYDVWGRLPYCREGMIGSGAYAMSEEGRRRFDRFPSITADDAYVRLLFRPEERATIEDCKFTVTAPTTVGGIIKIKTRSHFGNHELRTKWPELFNNEGRSHQKALLGLAKHPAMWPKLLVYCYVKLIARLRSRWQYRFGDHAKWERDDTARAAVLAASLPVAKVGD